MTLDEIYKSNKIGVRSYNICKDNGLSDMTLMLEYFKKNTSFKNLKNCGSRSDQELIDLCLKYLDPKDLIIEREEKKSDLQLSNKIHDESSETKTQLFSYKVSNFNRIQREVINSFIEINSYNLTNRSKNAIRKYLDGNFKIRNFSEKILSNNEFNIQNIENVGAKSTREINSFIALIKEFVANVSKVKDEKKLVSMKNRFFIEKSFSISEVPSEILESISIFKLTDFLISSNAVFEKNQNLIFQKAFKVYRNQPEFTLNEIAQKFNISSERVRQIRKNILENLYTNLQFVKNIEDELFQKYKIDINQNLIFIDDNLTDFINGGNDTNFSKEFISYLIYVYISDKYSIIGNLDDVLLPKYFNSRERHNWEYFYLIDREIDKMFQFNDFANDIDKRLNERIEEAYKFHFKSYLSNFLRDTSIDLLEQVTEIAEPILNNEFGIYLDLEDNLQFSRNSVKPAYEYAYEALKQIGKPAKVNEITKKILELHPDYETDEAKVRASMKRQNGFIPVSRNSVFGLKIWENELSNFKGGTIKDIIEEFLQDKAEPQHILKVITYLNSYRKDKEIKSVLTNLKVDPIKRFVVYNQGFIGLNIYKNNYNSKYELLPAQLGKRIINLYEKGYSILKIKEYLYKDFYLTNEESDFIIKNLNLLNNNLRKDADNNSIDIKNSQIEFFKGFREDAIKLGPLNNLIKFITDNQRMPNSRDPNETSLYHFYYRNKKFLVTKENHSEEEKRLVELINKFGGNEKKTHSIGDLIKFISDNQRMPNSRDPDERSLYYFYYRSKRLFKQGALSPDDENSFISIDKIIRTHKYEN